VRWRGSRCGTSAAPSRSPARSFRALQEDVGLRARASLDEFDAAQCPGIPRFVSQGQRFRGKDRLDDLVEALHDAGMERGETTR